MIIVELNSGDIKMNQVETLAKDPWRFPVELQDVYTSKGDKVPYTRAVVRTDTMSPLCSVGKT